MGNVIIIGILAVLVIFAVKGTIKHSKGEGGCCGGGCTTTVEHKELDGEYRMSSFELQWRDWISR